MNDDDVRSRLKQLLASLPGVRITWFEPALPATSGRYAGHARYGMEINNARTLSQIVHLACSVNVPLAVETDWNCGDPSRHDDPSCIRYDLRVEPSDLDALEQVLRHAFPHERQPPD
jgi:hypothetical protein